jgi:hypothetical protein
VGLVVASGVDDEVAQDLAGGGVDEVAQDLAGGGVDDGDVEVLDEQDDVGSGVGSADADVAEAAGDSQGGAPALSILSWRTRSWAELDRRFK